MKHLLKLLALVLSALLITALTYYGYYQWRQAQVYEDKITITARYLKYACGDCSLDMKVTSVADTNYQFLVGQEIFPVTQTRKDGILCDFISSSGHKAATTPDYIEEVFTLTGYLHKYSRSLPFTNCTESPGFTVVRIKYGEKGQWKDF